MRATGVRSRFVTVCSGQILVVFGLLVMDPGVVEGWTGEPVTALPFAERANWQLIQVSTFLAAFSGLYFTVYAVTDTRVSVRLHRSRHHRQLAPAELAGRGPMLPFA